MTPRLELTAIRRSFGGLVVSNDVHLTLQPGARAALIGPNGAGKTTLVNIVTGALRPDAGTIRIDGQDITRMAMPARVRAGIGRTYQINRLFGDLTVADNVRIAAIQEQRLASMLVPRAAAEASLDRAVHETLSGLGLSHLAGRQVRQLAYGEQRLLEIALALALKPRVLLLDEPAAGVPQGESGVIIDVVQNLPGDLAVLLIEHDMDLVFRFARYIYVLADGTLVAEGAPAAIASDARVKELYFGRDDHGRPA